MRTKDRYARLAGRFWRHPKAMAASDAALALWTRALSYTVDQMTDGHITRAVGATLCRRGLEKVAAELVALGLWEAHPEDGWIFHDYDDHNVTRAKWEAEAERNRNKTASYRSKDTPVTGNTPDDVTGNSQTQDARRKTISEIDPAPTDPDPPPLGRVLSGFRERWDRRYAAQWRPTDANLKAARQRADEYAERPEKLAETLDGFFATDDAFVLGKRHPFALWSNDPERWIPGKKPQEPPVSIEEHTAKRRAEIAANNARRYGGSA